MKTLKITLALVAVLLLTVSGVKSETDTVNGDEPTYKEYDNNDLIAHRRGKAKLISHG